MRALIINSFGPPSVLTQTEIPKPRILPGHLIIAVKATSINPIDCKIRSGAVPALAPDFPAVLHGDVAGIVDEVGQGVTRFRIGDPIYACAGGVKGTGGALAEFMLADADCVAHKPASLSFSEAAALPLVTITAWLALFVRASLHKGQSVLIHGGVGGVGHIGVQLARSVEAQVAATVSSPDDFPTVQKLGAHHPINYRTESVPDYVQRVTNGEGFNVIFDTVGGKNLELSFQAAALCGGVATTSSRSTNDLNLMHQKGLSLYVINMLLPLLTGHNRKDQGEILEKAVHLADEGKLKPLIDPRTFSIQDAAAAHAYLESGEATGKVVLAW